MVGIQPMKGENFLASDQCGPAGSLPSANAVIHGAASSGGCLTHRKSGEHLAPMRDGGLEAIYYQPTGIDPSRPPLVLVHGISRNAHAQIQAFIPLADELGMRLLAPVFPRAGHQNYQRPATRSATSDTALLNLLKDINRHSDADFSRVDMFGFSAGAQFAHRFAFMQPQRIRKLLLASSGWYTFPHVQNAYPYGIGLSGVVDPRIDLDGFLELSIKVIVGQRDINRDPGLRIKGNVDRIQGWNRLARAENWARSISEIMAAYGATGEVHFETLPGCGHSFDDCVTVGGLRRLATAWFNYDD